MSIEKIYILLSECVENIVDDVEMLYKKGIVTKEQIESDHLLVCISRDYLRIDNPTPAVMIRDQLSNVFCPKWRMCSTYYTPFRKIMNAVEEDIPEIYVMTKNKEIYEDLDYYLHLTRFDSRNKMLLGSKKESFVPIKSNVSRSDIVELGELTVALFEMAGYNKGSNGQIPGWVVQCANPWMTRVLDLYDVEPILSIFPEDLPDLMMSRDEMIKLMSNPILMDQPKVGEDIRTSITDSFDVRKKLYELSKDLLKRI